MEEKKIIIIFVVIFFILLMISYTRNYSNINEEESNEKQCMKLLKKHIYHLHKNYMTLSRSFENILNSMNYIHSNTAYNSQEIYNLIKQNEYMQNHFHLIPKNNDSQFDTSKRLQDDKDSKRLKSSLREVQMFL